MGAVKGESRGDMGETRGRCEGDLPPTEQSSSAMSCKPAPTAWPRDDLGSISSDLGPISGHSRGHLGPISGHARPISGRSRVTLGRSRGDLGAISGRSRPISVRSGPISRLVERRAAVVVPRVDVRPPPEEHLDQLDRLHPRPALSPSSRRPLSEAPGQLSSAASARAAAVSGTGSSSSSSLGSSRSSA